MPRHVHPALALAAGLAAALSGCSAGPTSGSPATQATYSPAVTDVGSSPPATGDVAAASPATGITAPTPTPPAPALAGTDFTRKGVGSNDTVHLRFDVLSLTRQGQLLQLAVRITSEDPVASLTNDSPLDRSWNLTGLSDTSRAAFTSTSGIGEAYSGTALVDVAAKKRYLVAVDSSGNCLCTADLSHFYMIGPGQSLTLNATYAAPPATTTRLEVDVPGIGSFADVPIS
jgi:hypothetical protein